MKYLIGIAISFLFCGISLAETVCVAENTAELRSSPTISGSYVLLKAPLYYPFSVLGSSGDFYEVSDFLGRKGWIQKLAVNSSSGVVVKRDIVNIRKGPGKNHDIVFKARKGVTFQALGEHEDWLQVRHESGKRGWIWKALTWGQ